MLPEADEIRRALSERRFRSIERVWPAIRQTLAAEAATRRRPSARAWMALAVFLLVLVAIVLWDFQLARRWPPSIGFGVANVRSLGRPAEALVLHPDARTVIVIVH